MYLNKAIIVGNLTRDPEVKSLPNGQIVTTFSVATNRTHTDKQGQRQESTDYHNIVAFGKQAEILSQYCKKGSGLLVEGRIQTRSWDGTDGKKIYRTEVIVEKFELGPRPSTDRKVEQKTESEEPIEYPETEINPDDIPF